MIIYLIQVTLCLAIFYAFYHIALKRETMFHTNRLYLLTTLMISLVLPLIKIYIDALPEASELIISSGTYFYSLDTIIIQPEQNVFPWGKSLMAIYFTGVVIMAFRLLSAIREILQIRSNGNHTIVSGKRCILSDDVKTPFSFFNTVYLPRHHRFQETELREVFAHEMAHIEEKHTWDILLMELVCIALWPSPIVYLYRKSLKDVHEYVADAAVIKDTPWENYAQLLVSQQSNHLQNILSHQLIYSQLKKRLLMMNKERSGGWARYKYMGIIPILLLAMVIFSFREKEKLDTQANATALGQSQTDLSKDFDLNLSGSKMQKSRSGDALPEGNLTALRTPDPVEGKLNARSSLDAVLETNQSDAEHELPIFPGCENIVKEDEKRTCSSNKMMEYIMSHLQYPEELRRSNLQGKVMVRFVVGSNGLIKLVEVIKSLSPEADKAALDLINGMNLNVGKWEPATKEGKPVDTELILPINFALNSDKQDEPYIYVEEMPRFPGCEHLFGTTEHFSCWNYNLYQWILTHIRYPEEDRKNKLEGQGIVQFVVQADGQLTDFKVIRSPSPSMTSEIMRLMGEMASMPEKWIPGKHLGITVPVTFTLPIKFALQEQETKVKDEVKISSLVVTPNPANNTISIDLSDGAQAIKIFDASSRLVISQEVTAGNTGKHSIDVSSLLPGQYVIQIQMNSRTESGTFVIQK